MVQGSSVYRPIWMSVLSSSGDQLQLIFLPALGIEPKLHVLVESALTTGAHSCLRSWGTNSLGCFWLYNLIFLYTGILAWNLNKIATKRNKCLLLHLLLWRIYKCCSKTTSKIWHSKHIRMKCVYLLQGVISFTYWVIMQTNTHLPLELYPTEFTEYFRKSK